MTGSGRDSSFSAIALISRLSLLLDICCCVSLRATASQEQRSDVGKGKGEVERLMKGMDVRKIDSGPRSLYGFRAVQR